MVAAVSIHAAPELRNYHATMYADDVRNRCCNGTRSSGRTLSTASAHTFWASKRKMSITASLQVGPARIGLVLSCVVSFCHALSPFVMRCLLLSCVVSFYCGHQRRLMLITLIVLYHDLHYHLDLQLGNEQTRRRLAVYCMKDAYLPLRYTRARGGPV